MLYLFYPAEMGSPWKTFDSTIKLWIIGALKKKKTNTPLNHYSKLSLKLDL